jgi:hypothetical protein
MYSIQIKKQLSKGPTAGHRKDGKKERDDTSGIRTQAGEPTGLAGLRLNHSAKVSKDGKYALHIDTSGP